MGHPFCLLFFLFAIVFVCYCLCSPTFYWLSSLFAIFQWLLFPFAILSACHVDWLTPLFTIFLAYHHLFVPSPGGFTPWLLLF